MASKTLASLIVRIGADVTGVTAGLNTLEKRTRSIKKQFSTVKDSTLSWQAALGTLAGAAGLAFVAKKVFDLGSALEETSSKFSTVFGPATKDAQKFLDEFANTAGLTNQMGQDVLATTGAIVQGMGMSQQASASFAKEIVSLAGDLSSFNNIPIAETARAVQSALTGERESLKQLGIVILETDVQQKALAMTGKATAKELTAQEKATATLALITERAGVAVGDLARTMDSPANRARKIAAEFGDLRDSIAAGLMPAFGVLLEELDGSASGFDNLRDAISSSGAHIEAWARFAVDAFKFVTRAMAAPITVAFNLGQVLGDLARVVFFALTGQFEKAAEASKSMIGQFGDIGTTVKNLVKSFDDMRVSSGIAWGAVSDGAKDAAATVTTVVDEVATALGRLGGMKATGPSAGLMRGFKLDVAPDKEKFKKFWTEMQDHMGVQIRKMNAHVEMFRDRFVDTLVDGIMQGKLAFRDFANFVIAELLRIQIRKILTGVLTSVASSTTGTGVIGSAGTSSTGSVFEGAGIGLAGASTAGFSMAPATVVHQVINFSVSAIDARDAARFVQEQKGAISQVVADAARGSSGFRRALAGA